MKSRDGLLQMSKIALAHLARKSASIEANTTCPYINYQPNEPKEIKKLRKF